MLLGANLAGHALKGSSKFGSRGWDGRDKLRTIAEISYGLATIASHNIIV